MRYILTTFPGGWRRKPIFKIISQNTYRAKAFDVFNRLIDIPDIHPLSCLSFVCHHPIHLPITPATWRLAVARVDIWVCEPHACESRAVSERVAHAQTHARAGAYVGAVVVHNVCSTGERGWLALDGCLYPNIPLLIAVTRLNAIILSYRRRAKRFKR